MRAASFACIVAFLVGCEASVRFDYLAGIQFAAQPMPDSCMPGVLPAGETVPDEPTTPGDPTTGGEGCDVPLLTRTQGFWKNHPCVLSGDVGGMALLPVTLGEGLVLSSPTDVTGYLQTPPKGGNAQIILGHQLLAAKLNAAAFGIGHYVFADVGGDGILETVDELLSRGDAAFDSGSAFERQRMAAVLDRLNNAGDEESLSFEPACGGAGSE